MSIVQLDTENADRNLTSAVTCLTHTPSATDAMQCQGLIMLGDGTKNLDGSGGSFELTVTVGGQTVEPNPQTITFSTAVRACAWTTVFPVPPNAEVILKVKSPNAADTDVDVTAYLYDVSSYALASVCTETRLAELDAANLPADVDTVVGKLPYNYIMGSANQSDYSDDITNISSWTHFTYNKLPTGYIMGSSDANDHDTDIDAILADTNEIQGKLPTNYIMGSSDVDDHDADIDIIATTVGTILTDTNEIQSKLPTDYIMGSSVKDSFDDDIDAILADTNEIQGKLPTNYIAGNSTPNNLPRPLDASDTADAVWDAAVADHILPDTMGAQAWDTATWAGNVNNKLPYGANFIMGSSDENAHDADIDAILADTNEIQGKLPTNYIAGASGPGDLSVPTAAQNADAVWDEEASGHSVSGSFAWIFTWVSTIFSKLPYDYIAGNSVPNNLPTPLSASDTADAVWDAAVADHILPDTMGAQAWHTATWAGNVNDKLPYGADFIMGSNDEKGHDTDIDTIVSKLPTNYIAGSSWPGDLSIPTPAQNADAVWDEVATGHTVSNSFAWMYSYILSMFSKLPMNYIMGSSDKSDHDEDIDTILADVVAILADTNEIQGKLPTDYIMGNTTATSMDVIINNTNTLVSAVYSKLPTDYIMGNETAMSMGGIINNSNIAINQVHAKLPTNYIMGSSDVGDHDGDIDAILADTDELQGREALTSDGIADAVWSWSSRTLTSLTSVAQSVWDVLSSACSTAGSVGKLLVEYLNGIGVGSYSITVTVKDSNGVPLSGRVVQLRNDSGALVYARQVTDSSGQVGWNVDNGTWTVQILGDPNYSWDANEQDVTVSGADETCTFVGTLVEYPATLGRVLGTLIDEVRDSCGNMSSAISVLTNDRVTRWINQAKDDIAQVWNTSLLECRDSVTLSDGTQTLDLGTALSYVPREILGIWIRDDTNEVMYEVERKEHSEMMAEYAEVHTPSDEEQRPQYWSQVGMTLYWHRVPDATYTAEILYRHIPGDLTYTDGTETNLLTRYAPNALVAYAVYQAYAFLEQPKASAEWYARYQQALKQLVSTEGRRMTVGLDSPAIGPGGYRQ